MENVYKEKGSKFYGIIKQVNTVTEFNAVLAEIKKEHKNASHFCYAYIINENNMLYEKQTNAREPGGCGAALMNLLKSNNLTNCALVVVRYFGGTKLGVGNLIRAYTAAGKTALQNIMR